MSERHPVGEQTRVFAQPSAAARNADSSTDLQATIWYPATTSAAASPLLIGPAEDPYMCVGSVAKDAPVASGGRYPVILYSHGNNGSARTNAWFGVAMARAGYFVVAVDHPGNNLESAPTFGGALLWWLRANDLQCALDGVLNDAVLGRHVDPERVVVAGYSLGGMTALIALGAKFDGRLYDNYCRTKPDSAVSPPAEALPIFDPGKASYPGVIGREMARMTDEQRVPRAKAGLIIAPLAIGLQPESLCRIDAPVTFVVGSDDAVTTPEVGAAFAAASVPNAEMVIVTGASHDSFINICTTAGIAASYCGCAVATEQEAAHRAVLESALALFGRIETQGSN